MYDTKQALQKLRTFQYRLFDGKVLLVRELVTRSAVVRDPDGLQHGIRDPVAIPCFSHKRRDCLDMRPPLLASHLW